MLPLRPPSSSHTRAIESTHQLAAHTLHTHTHRQLTHPPHTCENEQKQSTYCEQLWNHCQAIGRPVHCVNLDPAAEAFGYPVSVDVRDLVALEDVMEEMGLGPNG